MIKKMKFFGFIGLALVMLVTTPGMVLGERLPWYEQSPTATGTGGAAATEHPLATQAAMDILNMGGNAVEAAIAASAVQGVVRPFSGGIGGGGYMLIYLKAEDRFVVLDHRSASVSTFDATTFIDPATGLEYEDTIRQNSGPGFGIPGVVKAWEQALQQYGTGLSFSTILQPAINIAQNGFYADANFIRELSENAARFCAYQPTIDLFLNPDCSVPAEGTLMINTDLASTYQLIAQNGSSVFYNGVIGQAIVDTVNNPPVVANPPYTILPGNMSLSDLQNYIVPEYDAVSVNYRGYDVYGAPPSSSGGTTIGLALNILEEYDMDTLPREEALHYYIEATRHAFADRYAYLGDPLTYTGGIPTTGLLSKNYAERVRQDITEYGTEHKVDEKDPWPFDTNPNLWQDPLRAPGKNALTYHFTGDANGSTWDSTGNFITTTGSGQDIIDIQNEAGNMNINHSQFSYARAETVMNPVTDSELLVRFKMDQLDGDRNLRFWLKADGFNASTSPHNGYGVEINTADDTVRIIRTRDSNQVHTLATFNHMRTTDWQWLRFRVEGDQLKVRIWKDSVYEPRQSWTHSMQDSSVTGEGKLLISAIELSGATSGGSFKVDDIYVTELNPIFFEEDFTGVIDGSTWDSTGSFITQYGTGNSNPGVGASIDVQLEGGHMYLNKDKFAYARAESTMGTLYDSELLVKFKINELTDDRRLRFWLRADSFNSLSAPHNGYGVEIQSGVDSVKILRTRNSNGAFALTEISHPRKTTWQWLRFRVEGEGIKVKIWDDGTSEPLDWLHERNNDQVVGPGKLLMSSIELTGGTGTVGGSFDVDDIKVYDLDILKNRESTIHLTVADSVGNIVSYTHTLNSIGGNSMVVPGYGILLNNEIAPRVPSVAPVGHPDAPRPGMRPLSSMSPTIVMKDGQPVLALGSPGGQTILTSVLQTMINYLDFGMTLPEAIASPRLSQTNANGTGHTLIEPEFVNTAEYDQLRARKQFFDVTGLSYGIGSVNAIAYLPDGQIQAASEPVRRGGGSAMVQNPAQGQSNTIHVQDITMALHSGQGRTWATATILITDDSGNPVENATVSGQWSSKTTDSDCGTTGADGKITVSSNKVQNPGKGTYTFTVNNVTHASFTYDSNDNVETSDSITK